MYKGTSAKFHIHPDSKPMFYKARLVQYVPRAKVEAEPDQLEKEHILELVQFFKWAARSPSHKAKWISPNMW